MGESLECRCEVPVEEAVRCCGCLLEQCCDVVFCERLFGLSVEMCVEDGSVECDACIVLECGDNFGVALNADWFGDGCALYKCRESVVFCGEPVGGELCG